MKRIFNAVKWAWKVYRQPKVFSPAMLGVLQAQTDFLQKTAESNRPMMTDLCMMCWDEGEEKEIKILTLWCGVGLGTPLDRIRELAEENKELKRQLAGHIKVRQETTK